MIKYVIHSMCIIWCTAIHFTIASAQVSNEPKELSRTYYLKNVIIHTTPTDSLMYHDLVFDNGVIIKIGKNITPPFNAQTLPVDSMHVYCGFIDGFSRAGLPTKKDSKDEQADNNKPKIAEPEQKIEKIISLNEKSVQNLRNAGFVISQVASDGLMLPGNSAIVFLDPALPNPYLNRDYAQVFQFKTNRDFPATNIGVMSAFREMYKNAAYQGQYEKEYAQNPKGLQAPAIDATLSALYPVTKMEKPLIVPANNLKTVYRTFELQDQTGFNLILVDVTDLDYLQARVKSKNVPIFLSLKLPELPKKDSTITDVDYPEFERKRTAKIIDLQSLPSKLAKDNIAFGFSSHEVSPDKAKAAILLMIKNGLSKKAALAALTQNPAQMLGIANITGTVETGKLANLIISKGEYFDEKSNLAYAIVNGNVHKMEISAKKDLKKTKDLDGKWSYTVEISGGAQTGIIDISNGLEDITVIDDEDEVKLKAYDQSYKDGTLKFTINIEIDGNLLPSQLNLNFNDTKYSGTVSIPNFGEFPIYGSKTDPKL